MKIKWNADDAEKTDLNGSDLASCDLIFSFLSALICSFRFHPRAIKLKF